MKRMLTAVVLAATAVSLALAQSSGNEEKTQDDANAKLVETFTKIENEWAQADKTMDAVALGKLLGDDWFFLGRLALRRKLSIWPGSKRETKIFSPSSCGA